MKSETGSNKEDTMKVYGAIPSGDSWTVGRCSKEYRDMNAVSNVRTFATFEDADRCAREIAGGKFPEIASAGEYVNMR